MPVVFSSKCRSFSDERIRIIEKPLTKDQAASECWEKYHGMLVSIQNRHQLTDIYTDLRNCTTQVEQADRKWRYGLEFDGETFSFDDETNFEKTNNLYASLPSFDNRTCFYFTGGGGGKVNHSSVNIGYDDCTELTSSLCLQNVYAIGGRQAASINGTVRASNVTGVTVSANMTTTEFVGLELELDSLNDATESVPLSREQQGAFTALFLGMVVITMMLYMCIKKMRTVMEDSKSGKINSKDKKSVLKNGDVDKTAEKTTKNVGRSEY